MWYFALGPLGVAFFLYFWGTDWLYSAATQCVAAPKAECGFRMKYWSELFIDLYHPDITPAIVGGISLLIVFVIWLCSK